MPALENTKHYHWNKRSRRLLPTRIVMFSMPALESTKPGYSCFQCPHWRRLCTATGINVVGGCSQTRDFMFSMPALENTMHCHWNKRVWRLLPTRELMFLVPAFKNTKHYHWNKRSESLSPTK